ncbi:MAG: type III pantothenate kinase [Brevinematales bacterium]|nr:type III pantothenate kinase [Brevinematales bacterium]
MLVAIDIGNTNITFGLFEKKTGKLLNSGNLKTDIFITTEELAIFYKDLKNLWAVNSEIEEEVLICSVVPQLNYEFTHMFEKYFRIKPHLIENSTIPVKIDYDFPQEIGTDRLVNAYAGTSLYPKQNLIIVDFGTATTLDIIDKNKTYMGGIILPGIITSLRALETKTAKLPHIHLIPPKKVVGRNTVECIRSGVFNGQGGMIDELVRRITKELNWSDFNVIATGGLSRVIKDFAFSINIIEPHLTLFGIYNLWKEKN